MKRTISIVLLLVFLFNLGGYYLLFTVLRLQANIELRARLDADQYSDEELIEIRMPVTLPYPLQDQDFQRVDGKFVHNGQFFKMVKHKIENDVLIILCIKDQEEQSLDKTMRNYTKLANDLPGASKKTQNILAKFLKDFDTMENGSIVHGSPWQRLIQFHETDFNITDAPFDRAVPPPRG